jgi:hypothetical protein
MRSFIIFILHHIVTCLVTVDGVWIVNWIYWSPTQIHSITTASLRTLSVSKSQLNISQQFTAIVTPANLVTAELQTLQLCRLKTLPLGSEIYSLGTDRREDTFSERTPRKRPFFHVESLPSNSYSYACSVHVTLLPP